MLLLQSSIEKKWGKSIAFRHICISRVGTLRTASSFLLIYRKCLNMFLEGVRCRGCGGKARVTSWTPCRASSKLFGEETPSHSAAANCAVDCPQCGFRMQVELLPAPRV